MATSATIFGDAEEAQRDPSHPCHYLIEHQGLTPKDPWQLPVPFMGRTADLGLIFVGFNPSWSYPGDEPDPRWGSKFEAWDAYWRGYFEERMDDLPLLYRKYIRIASRVKSDFVLGRDAVVVEVVRYRSSHARDVTKAALEHEAAMTKEVISDLTPKAILVGGNDATWGLIAAIPSLAGALKDVPGITRLEGQILRVDAPWGGRVAIVPWRHLTGGWVGGARLDLAGDTLLAALTGE